MEFPVDFWSIPAHLVFEILGYVAGFTFLMRERRIHGDTVDSENRAWLILAALVGPRLLPALPVSLAASPFGTSTLSVRKTYKFTIYPDGVRDSRAVFQAVAHNQITETLRRLQQRFRNTI